MLSPQEREARRAALDARLRAVFDKPRLSRLMARGPRRFLTDDDGAAVAAEPAAPVAPWSADGAPIRSLTGATRPDPSVPQGAPTARHRAVLDWLRAPSGAATVMVADTGVPRDAVGPRPRATFAKPVRRKTLTGPKPGTPNPAGAYRECPRCGLVSSAPDHMALHAGRPPETRRRLLVYRVADAKPLPVSEVLTSLSRPSYR